MKRKVEPKVVPQEEEEDLDYEGMRTPVLVLTDGFMDKLEMTTRVLAGMETGIGALVKVIERLSEAMEKLAENKEEKKKVDKQTGMEDMEGKELDSDSGSDSDKETESDEDGEGEEEEKEKE